METTISILTGADVTEKHVAQAVELDKMAFSSDCLVPYETCLSYIQRNKWTYFMAVDEEDKVIGYLNFSPVRADIYDGILAGTVLSTDITADDLTSYEEELYHYGCIPSIVVHYNYRKLGIATSLLDRLDTFLLSLRQRGYYFRGIIADAVSPVGATLLYRNHFYVVNRTNHNSIIMRLY